MNEKIDVDETPPSAEALRMSVLQKEMEKVDIYRKAREVEEREARGIHRDFMNNHVSEDEMAMSAAAGHERGEGMASSRRWSTASPRVSAPTADAPSTTAIRAGLRRCKARRRSFESYEELAKPRGYKLKAMVINFPGGIPGDIGFFLNWAPPTV